MILTRRQRGGRRICDFPGRCCNLAVAVAVVVVRVAAAWFAGHCQANPRDRTEVELNLPDGRGGWRESHIPALDAKDLRLMATKARIEVSSSP